MHRPTSIRTSVAVWAFLAAFACAGLAAADETPDAASIVDRSVWVTGGAEAYAKVENRVTRSTMRRVGQGSESFTTVFQARPARMYSVTDNAALGKSEQGSDGYIVWERAMPAGPKILEGAERALLLRGNSLDVASKWRDFYRSAEYAGMGEVEGEPCHKVVMTANEGDTETRCYDRETGFLVRIETKTESRLGKRLSATVLPSDYQAVDGILLPHSTRFLIVGQVHVVTVTSIEQNVDLADDFFDLPKDVLKLLARK